ncbi:hypothetical protein GAQ90_16230 [Bacteroides uniformis]|nr:hypothetical protein GAQ90_16230 [Bacteroides uniformis]
MQSHPLIFCITFCISIGLIFFPLNPQYTFRSVPHTYRAIGNKMHTIFHQTEDIIPHEYANLSLLVRRIIFKFAVTILLILLIKKIHETTAPIPYMQPGLPPYCSR